jgi:translation initiation factor 5
MLRVQLIHFRSRPCSYSLSLADPTKFFGCELGAQATFNNERYIVNGAHQPDRLRELLDIFITKFVLCASCKNPETVLLVDTKREEITRDCKACGAQTQLDMKHKLCTFILKNPPAGSGAGSGKKGKKGAKGVGEVVKKDKYAEAEEMREAQLAGTNLPTLGAGAGSGGGTGTGSPTAEDDDLDKAFKNPALNRKIKDDDWAVDTSAEAVAARMKHLAVNVDGFAGGLGDDDEDGEFGGDSKYTAFGVWIEENKDSATDAEVASKAKELEVYGKHKACIELGQKLWGSDLVKDVEKRSKILKVVSTTFFLRAGSNVD